MRAINHQGRLCNGFTLFELLIVMVVLAIILSFAVPAAVGLSSASLSGTGRILSQNLDLCRNQAISERTAVRLGIAIDGPNEAEAYRKYAIWKWNPKARDFKRSSKWFFLPENVTFEPLRPDYIDDSQYAEDETTSVEGDYMLAPNSSDQFDYTTSGDSSPHQIRFVHFSPSGRASIPGHDERNILFVMRLGTPDNIPNDVSNWVQITIDTLTGRHRIYGP